jgi:hypothetical protein
MIAPMESPRHEERDAIEAGSGQGGRPSGEPYVSPAVCELTARELDRQRNLVRESLLLRSA